MAIEFSGRTVFSWFTAIIDEKLLTTGDIIMNRGLVAAGELVLIFGSIIMAFYGLAIALGWTQAPASGFAKIVGKFAFFSFVTGGAAYAYWVRDAILVAAPAYWVNAVSSATGVATGASAFDSILADAMAAGFHIWSEFSAYNPMKLLVALYFIVAGAGIVCGYGIWLIAHLMAVLYVAIGPIFLPLALFAVTRAMFSAWVGVTVSAVVLQGLSLALASLLVGAEGSMANAILISAPGETYGRLGMLFGAALVFGLCGWFALRLPAVAASLCGGIHFAPQAVVAATYGAVQGGARAAAGAAGGVAGRGAQAARRAIAGPSMAPPGPTLSRTPVTVGGP